MSRRFKQRVKDYNKTVIPGTDIKFKWENMGGPESSTDVWMDPKEFLSYTPPPPGGQFSKQSLKGLDEDVDKKKEVLYSPYLFVRYRDNQVTGHEGRHRALWLINKGVKEMPVHIVWDDSDRRFMNKAKNRVGKLKTQGIYERKKLGERYGTHGFYSALDVEEGTPIHFFSTPKPPQPKPTPTEPSRLSPEARARLAMSRSRRKHTKYHCPECAGDVTASDGAKARVCLQCGIRFKI